MNLFLSIDPKFYIIPPDKLIGLIKNYDKHNIVKGIELRVANLNSDELKHALRIVKLIKDYSMQLTLHAFSLDNSMHDHFKLLDIYNILSDVYNKDKTINITYHPYSLTDISRNQAILLSISALNEIERYIKNKGYNFNICLENLDDLNGIERLKVKDIETIILNTENTYLTYDIGNEITEGILEYTIPTDIQYKIMNIHIHDIKRIGTENIPHYPFIEYNTDPLKVKKLIKKIDYSGNIVLELIIDYLQGNTLEEKLFWYIEELNKVNEILIEKE